jgi:pilus assembly protein CpaE
MINAIRFVILSNSAATAEDLHAALKSSGRSRVLERCENADQMYTDVLRLQPTAAIIALGANAEDELSLVKRLSTAAPDTFLITAAENASPALVMSSMRAGAREFLQLPVNAEELSTVLLRVEEFAGERKVEQKKHGRVVGVFSCKGGAGVSFVATNLAAVMDAPTLLVDLNLQAGDLDSFIAKTPSHTIADLVKNRQRLDDALLGSLVTPYSEKLALLAAPLEAYEADDITPDHIFEIIHFLRSRYENIVMDLQHTFDPITIAALDQVDAMLLVMTLDIPGIRNTKRALRIFDRIGYSHDKIKIVVNRYSKKTDVELKHVESHLGESLIGFILNDYVSVMESINMGRPLVSSEPGSKIAVELRRIADALSGYGAPPAAQPRKGLLRSLFSRGASLELNASIDKA